jgi:Flp pilus assembly protein TadD
MKRAGLTCVATSAVWIGLLAGCSSQHEGQQHALTAESRLRVADAAEASGDKQTALSMYAAAANDSPNDTQMQLRSAEGLARNGNLEDASAILTRRLKATPHDADLQRTLGAIQVMSGEQARAILTFTDVLASKPDDVKAMVNKAVALDLLHKHDLAQDLYRKALAETPDDLTINNDLALSLLLSGHQEEARLTMLPFREASNLPERIKTNMGIVDAAAGHSAEAREFLGSRIAAGDLASLTQAISMQGSGFQPDANRRSVAHGPLTDPAFVHPEPVAVRVEPVGAAKVPATARATAVIVPVEPIAPHAAPASAPALPVVYRVEPVAPAIQPIAASVERHQEPVLVLRPLQEQRPVRASSSVASPSVASPSVVSSSVAQTEPPASSAASPNQPAPDAKPVTPLAARIASSVPPPPLLAVRGETTIAGAASVGAHAPLQEDLIPRNVRAAHVEPTAATRSLVQEPLAPPDATIVRADAVASFRRPLQEQATAVREPTIQPETPPVPQRPLQEQAAGAVASVVGSPSR